MKREENTVIPNMTHKKSMALLSKMSSLVESNDLITLFAPIEAQKNGKISQLNYSLTELYSFFNYFLMHPMWLNSTLYSSKEDFEQRMTDLNIYCSHLELWHLARQFGNCTSDYYIFCLVRGLYEICCLPPLDELEDGTNMDIKMLHEESPYLKNIFIKNANIKLDIESYYVPHLLI